MNTTMSGGQTYRCWFIVILRAWISRKHGAVNFHISQALTNHGYLSAYLHKFGLLDNPSCWYCGHHSDDAYHTLFICDTWYASRNRLNFVIEEEFIPETLVGHMISSSEKWNFVVDFITEGMSKKRRGRKKASRPATDKFCELSFCVNCRLKAKNVGGGG